MHKPNNGADGYAECLLEWDKYYKIKFLEKEKQPDGSFLIPGECIRLKDRTLWQKK